MQWLLHRGKSLRLIYPFHNGCINNSDIAVLLIKYLDGASLPKDDSDSIYVDHHRSDIGDLPVTSPVLILGVHGEVWQIRGTVARLRQGVRAGSHVMMRSLVIADVVGIAAH